MASTATPRQIAELRRLAGPVPMVLPIPHRRPRRTDEPTFGGPSRV